MSAELAVLTQIKNQSVIKSIQRGETTGTATITINEVDMDKTFVSSSFVSLGSTATVTGGTASYSFGKAGGKVTLTNSTTLDVVATDNNTTTSWEVIEYN